MGSPLPQKLVYYDGEYTTAWIPHDKAKQIADYLVQKHGYSQVNAAELVEVMKSALERESKDTTIVFAQDVAPCTVFDNNAATALIRQYLDCGGRIIWIGDIPFWYQGRKGARTVPELEQSFPDSFRIGQQGASVNILAVVPVMAPASNPCVIVSKGLRNKIRPWSGIRPVIIDDTIEPLAKSQALIAWPVISVEKRTLITRISRWLRGVEFQGMGVEFREPASKKETVQFYEEYANGWFKNFCKAKPLSGFLRVWDFQPSVLNLEELAFIATWSPER